MSLVALFRANAQPKSAQALAELPDAEVLLQRLYGQGQAQWPQLAVPDESFVRFLARQLLPEALRPESLPRLQLGDLFLICALGLGMPAAQTVLQQQYMPRVRRALLKQGITEDLIADMQQRLFQLLLEAQEPGATVRGYAGHGELVSWLCTCAIREANLRRKREDRLRSLDEIAEDLLLQVGKGPELDAMRRDLKLHLRAALQQALAELSRRERNVLRYHFLAGHSIDVIGDIYHVHRATAARWLAHAQTRLVERTRALFMQAVELHVDSLPRVWDLLGSQLSISLGSLLRSATDLPPEARPRAL